MQAEQDAPMQDGVPQQVIRNKAFHSISGEISNAPTCGELRAPDTGKRARC